MIVDAHMHLWNKINGRLGGEKVTPLSNGMILIGKRQIQGMPSWFSDCRNPAELAVAAFDESGVDIGMLHRSMILSIDLTRGAVQVKEMKRVLKRFPNLKVAIGHFGMVTMGNWMSQIRLAEFPNVYIECGGIIWLFRKEGPPFKKAQMNIRRAANVIGAHKIMWGSDYPRTMTEFTYRQSLEFATGGCEFFTPEEKAGFLGNNAARLYNLPKPLRKRQPKIRITEI